MLEAVGAERALLAIIMKKPDSLFIADEILEESDFTNNGNKLIYSLMRDILNEDANAALDHFILISRAEEKGIKEFFRLTNNGDLLEALEQTAKSVKESGLNKYIAAIKKATVKRVLINTVDELKDDIEVYDGGIVELRNFVEDTIFGAMRNIDAGEKDIVNLSTDFEDVINEYANDDATMGLDINLPRWERDCGRVRNGTITGIFARAKEGKSQFAAHSMRCVAIEGSERLGVLPTLYLDTEMQARDQQMRLCSMMTGIPYDRIESGAWRSKPDELELVKAAFKKIKGKEIYYKNIAGKSINYVIPVIRKFIHKYVGGRTEGNVPRCLVIYDYIKIMNAADLKHAQEYQVLGFLLSALHDLATDLNFPMIVFGQLNREGLRTDSIAAIAGSDRITHNVDSLTLFRKKKPEEIQVDGIMRGSHLMKVVISRKGPAHDYDEWVNVHFDKSRGFFKEDKRNSEINEAIRNSRPVQDRLGDEDTAEFGSIRE